MGEADLSDAERRLRARMAAGVDRPLVARQMERVLAHQGKMLLASVAAGLEAALGAGAPSGADHPGQATITPRGLPLSLSIDEAVDLLSPEPGDRLARALLDQTRLIVDIEDRCRFDPMSPAECERIAKAILIAGLLPQMLYAFDHEYYFYANAEVRKTVAEPRRVDCVAHYLDSGFHRMLPFSPYEFIEPQFYSETYRFGSVEQPLLTLSHWLTRGLSENSYPNRLLWARHNGLGSLRVMADLDLVRACAPFINHGGDCSWTDAFLHIHDGREFDGSVFGKLDWAGIHLLISFGDRLAVCGRQERARSVYEFTYSRAEGSELAASRYADALCNAGMYAAARNIYELHVGSSENIWISVNLAKCHEALGFWDEALAVLKQAVKRFSADAGAGTFLANTCRRCLDLSWRDAAAAMRFDRAEASAILSRAGHRVWDVLAPSPSAVLPKRKVRRVALYANRDLPQCRFYRVDQKREQLLAAGYDVEIFDFNRDAARFRDRAGDFDAVIFYRTHASVESLLALARAVELGLHTFYEIDDLTFDPEVFPPPLSTYEGTLSEKDYESLKIGPPLQQVMLDLCEHAIASTEPLARALRERNPSVFLHPNGLSHSHYEALRRRAELRSGGDGGPVRIVYGSGTKAHKSDFLDLLTPAIERLLDTPELDVLFVIVGPVVIPEALARRPDRTLLLPHGQSREEFWSLLAMADISLAPLVPTRLTDTKSEIKWMEAAMFAVPCVVGDTETYRGVVVDGVTGSVCDTPQSWSDTLVRLAGSPAERARIGAAAAAHVMETYALDRMADRLKQMFSQVEPKEETKRPVLAIVNVYYPPQSIGGATRVVHDNVTDLGREYGDSLGIEVFCSRYGEREPYVARCHAQDGVRVTSVSTPDRPDIDEAYFDDGMEAAFNTFLDDRKPDVIHFHCIQRLGLGLMRAAARRGINYVVTMHDGWWISPHQFLLDKHGDLDLYDHSHPSQTMIREGDAHFIRQRALRKALDGAERVTTVSAAFAKVCARAGLVGVEAIPNGLPNLGAPVAAAARRDGKIVLGFVGGVALHKGFDLLKMAVLLAQPKAVSILVVDHSLSLGQRLMERWGTVDVEFRGKVAQSHVGELYADMDILVAPSVWPESYGLVTREARHFGCWVIASDQGDIGGDVRPGQDGFVVPVETPEALAALLREIDAAPQRFTSRVGDPGEVRTSADQARDFARIYEELLVQRPAGRRLHGPGGARGSALAAPEVESGVA